MPDEARDGQSTYCIKFSDLIGVLSRVEISLCTCELNMPNSLPNALRPSPVSCPLSK